MTSVAWYSLESGTPGSHLPYSPLGAALPQRLSLVWRLLNGGGDDQNNVVSSSLGNSIEAKKKISTKKDEEPNVQSNKVEESIAALDNNQENCATETLESIAIKELLEGRENQLHFTQLRIEPQSLRLQQSSSMLYYEATGAHATGSGAGSGEQSRAYNSNTQRAMATASQRAQLTAVQRGDRRV
uniref:Uncharacterized protein n=1 Tax=Timema douglasi TaxID=61478 RepID=A0A7R8VV84_TIMDO|nr:unnamed protein product [Timema douglasi]